MILYDFRYQDPWAEENFTLRDFVQQGQAQQRQDQQADINRQTLDKLLTKLSQRDIVGLDHAREYLRHKYRQNCKANTLKNDFTTITLFLSYLKSCGKSQLDQVGRKDLEAYVEHEQDRGLKIISVSNRLGSLYAFLRYLIEHELTDAELLTRKIKLKVPDALPRAMDPDDVKCLLAVLDGVRNRAMILLLLRTGMRIGELLNTKVIDVHLTDKKIMIYEGEKNRKGRAVCISDDACQALDGWLQKRDGQKEYLIYAQGRQTMSYNNARVIFKKYLTRAGLQHKDYSLHCLRHTFATELLNAGMRIECLQQLLGHSSLEMTLRYARLSDKTREQEYFKAMAIIEGEPTHEPDQRDHQLPPLFEAAQLLTPYA
ncbi:MAG: tyrosine-type recombinase/integrase [Desulfobacterales bacterium]|nr:tyrosine-type recombinase/integrase [Desulfobacterales bacterium]